MPKSTPFFGSLALSLGNPQSLCIHSRNPRLITFRTRRVPMMVCIIRIKKSVGSSDGVYNTHLRIHLMGYRLAPKLSRILTSFSDRLRNTILWLNIQNVTVSLK